MSITGEFRRVTSWQLEELLTQVRDKADIFIDFLYPQTRKFDPPDPTLSIGIGWHSFHFLLNDNPKEVTSLAGRAVFGGHEIGTDLYYGPVRYMKPTEVKEIAEALRDVSEDDFKAQFSTEAFQAARIYPSGIQGNADTLSWLWETFQALRGFYTAGAEYTDAMLLYLA